MPRKALKRTTMHSRNFTTEIEGHVLASFMNYSGMSSMEGKSCKHNKICSTKKYVHKYVTWVF